MEPAMSMSVGWDDPEVLDLLNTDSGSDVWDKMNDAYRAFLSGSGLGDEAIKILKSLEVGLIRRKDFPEDPDSDAWEENPFWRDAFQATTRALRRFLIEHGVPPQVADLYSVREMAHVGVAGNSPCTKKCSNKKCQSVCC